MHALIVVESRTVQRVVQIAFESAAASCDAVASAQDALAALATKTYDVAVIDLDVSGVDGYALCQTLRQRAAGPLPVVLLASAQNPFAAAKAAEAGAAGCVEKPFATQALLQAALSAQRNEVEAAPGRGSAAHDKSLSPEHTNEPPAPATGLDVPSFDSALAALVAGPQDSDGAFFAEPPASAEPPANASKTIVRRASNDLRDRSRAKAASLPAPARAQPPQAQMQQPLASPPQAQPPQPFVLEPPAEPQHRPAPPPVPLPQQADEPPARHQQAGQGAVGVASLPPPTASNMAQELLVLLQQGPHQAHTPAINAALATILEEQVARILWQIVPGIVKEQVQAHLQTATKQPATTYAGHELVGEPRPAGEGRP